MPLRMVHLRPAHERALNAFLDDFIQAGEEEVAGCFGDPAWTHAEVVAGLAAWSRGAELPAGWIPCTTFFLEAEGELLGVVNIRHELTPALRRLGGHVGYSVRPSARNRGHATRLLEFAKAHAPTLGIDRVLVTCYDDNLASIRVIEKCGGILQDRIPREAGDGFTRRYWIEP